MAGAGLRDQVTSAGNVATGAAGSEPHGTSNSVYAVPGMSGEVPVDQRGAVGVPGVAGAGSTPKARTTPGWTSAYTEGSGTVLALVWYWSGHCSGTGPGTVLVLVRALVCTLFCTLFCTL